MKIPHNFLWAIFFIFLIACSFFYVVRPGFYGFDSYALLNIVCASDRNAILNESKYILMPLEAIIIDFLPCNEVFLKALLCFLLLIDLIGIYLIGGIEYSNETDAFSFLMLSFMSPIIFWETLKFENQSFALPFFFFGTYFYFKHLKTKKKIPLILSAILFLISLGFWGAPYYIFFIFSLYTLPFLIFTIPILILKFKNVLEGIIWHMGISENLPVWGIFFFYLYFMLWDIWTFQLPHKKISIPIITLGVMNPKFFILSIPFISLATKKFTRLPNLLLTIIGLGLFFVYFFTFAPTPLQNQPTQYQLDAVKDTVKYSKEKNLRIQNDFEYGHMIMYYGGDTNFHSGFGKKINPFVSSVILTRKEQPCHMIKQYDKPLLDFPLTLYKC